MCSTPYEPSLRKQGANEPIGKSADERACYPDGATLTFRERSVPSPKDVIRYFGDYELLHEIARGGMGVVFKARQITLNRIVAVKMILAGSFAGPEEVQRFYTEAEAAAQLDHPGIVPIYEVGQHEGQHYFSMGFVEGPSLAKRVAQGPLPPRTGAEIVRVVAEAVQYAHDKGIVHRDLKPGNILLDAQGKPRVTDFGLAKLMESGSNLTGTGQVLGTPAYMSPEQAACQSDCVGRLSDVYSLGAVLYCLLTGRPSFQAATPLETLYQVQRQEPVPPKQLNPDVPLDLDTIVLKCLEKSPNRRYDSAKELADELQRYLEGRPILARPVGRVDRFWRWCKREPVVAWLSAAVAVALTAGTIISSYYGVEASNRAREKSELAESERKASLKAQESLRHSIVTAVEAVQNSRGASVPAAIAALANLPREPVVEEIRSRLAKIEPDRRLALACALAEFGHADIGSLCEAVKQCASDELDNVVTALRHTHDESCTTLNDLAAKTELAQEWRFKARLAIVSLRLGEPEIAAEMCQVDSRPDPIRRTIFLDEFSEWQPGAPAEMLKVGLGLSDPALRSALCLAVGSVRVERLTASDRTECVEVIRDWFQAAPDAVTHSAAGWALRRWDVELPALEPSPYPDAKRDWYVNSLGMTLLRIRPGSFVRHQVFVHEDGQIKELPHDVNDQTVTLTNGFYLGDTEVTVGQFQRFLDDPDSDDEKPIDWDPQGAAEQPTQSRSAVNWYDAVQFCNWLSRKEGLAPCYERTGTMEQVRRGDDGDVEEYESWRPAPGGTGYRLPTEAEWEYACRAGTTTAFGSGDDAELLRKYALYDFRDYPGTVSCAARFPNGWGLFDMHGLVWEWCYDWYTWYGTGSVTDPTGPPEQPSSTSAWGHVPSRVIRGGCLGNPPMFCWSSSRFMYSPILRLRGVGFRVARGPVR